MNSSEVESGRQPFQLHIPAVTLRTTRAASSLETVTMPKDIRSYFFKKSADEVAPKLESGAPELNEALSTSSKKSSTRGRKIIIDSDEDSDSNDFKVLRRRIASEKGQGVKSPKKATASRATIISPAEYFSGTKLTAATTAKNNSRTSMPLREKSNQETVPDSISMAPTAEKNSSTEVNQQGVLDDSKDFINPSGAKKRVLAISDDEMAFTTHKSPEAKRVKNDKTPSPATKRTNTRTRKNSRPTPVRPSAESSVMLGDSADSDAMEIDEQEAKPILPAKRAGFMKHLNRQPTALGSKSIPEGSPDCLSGLTFVQTGELSSIARESISQLITKLGGRMTSAVSGKTNYLLVGDDAGQTKVTKADQLGVTKLTEDEFFEFIRSRSRTNSTELADDSSKPLINMSKRKSITRISLEPPSKIADRDIETISESIPNPNAAANSGKKGYFAYMNRKPSALGSKEIPQGAYNCLSGLTFVQTGELSSVTREDVTDLIRRYSGRLTSAVSGKTSYLIVGDQPGETKISKAKQLKVPQLSEDELFELIRTRPGASDAQVDEQKSKTQIANEKRVASIDPIAASNEYATWTDKYRPSKVSEIVGNKGNVEKLSAWLSNYDSSLKSGFQFTGDKNSTHLRAALLSGPPGIGKTTSAHIVAKSLGFHVIEFNASDVRSKKCLDSFAPTLLHSKTLFECPEMNPNAISQKHVVIMDEVDGMSSDDRGGLAQLTLLIKKTQVPLICICNDRSNPKLRTLSNYCLDLRYRRPEPAQVRSRLLTICFRENLQVQPQALDALVSLTQCDIRQVIQLLSTYRLGANSMNYDEAKAHAGSSTKDFSIGVFDAIKNLFSLDFRRQNLRQRMEHYFVDYDLMPLFVQENYIKCRSGNDMKDLMELSAAAENLAISNHIEKSIRFNQQWSLMSAHNIFSTVAPASILTGGVREMYQFPSILGQMSKTGKGMRIQAALAAHMSRKMAGLSKKSLRLDVLPIMSKLISGKIAKEHIESVIDTMDHYFLSRENLDEIFELGLGECSFERAMKPIPVSIKSKFTREFNKRSHPVDALEEISKRATKSTQFEDSDDGMAEEELGIESKKRSVSSDDENGDSENDVEASRAKPVKAKATSSSANRGRGGRATAGSARGGNGKKN